MWSLISLRTKRISRPEKFWSSPQKDFFNTICQEQTSYQLFGLDLTVFERSHSRAVRKRLPDCVAAALPARLGAVVCEIGSQFNFVALPASCWNACLNRVRSFSSSTILRLLGVSPRCDRPAQLAGCASSYPIPRIELSARGGERHILCCRSVPHAVDLYRDTVARSRCNPAISGRLGCERRTRRRGPAGSARSDRKWRPAD